MKREQQSPEIARQNRRFFYWMKLIGGPLLLTWAFFAWWPTYQWPRTPKSIREAVIHYRLDYVRSRFDQTLDKEEVQDAFSAAFEYHKDDVVRELVQHVDVNQFSLLKYPKAISWMIAPVYRLVYKATEAKHIEGMRILLAAGAKPGIKSSSGSWDGVLDVAAKNHCPEAVELLCEHGAVKPDIPNI